MSDVPAGECRIYLFEGLREDVQERANAFLEMQKDNPTVRLVDVLFNFQGKEYDGAKIIEASSSFGLGLVFQYVFPQASIDVAGRPVAARAIAAVAPVCALTPEVIFAAAAVANQPTTRTGRLWQRLARRFL